MVLLPGKKLGLTKFGINSILVQPCCGLYEHCKYWNDISHYWLLHCAWTCPYTHHYSKCFFKLSMIASTILLIRWHRLSWGMWNCQILWCFLVFSIWNLLLPKNSILYLCMMTQKTLPYFICVHLFQLHQFVSYTVWAWLTLFSFYW